MELLNISVPEVYKTSQDFRFFLKWFAYALSKIKYDTEEFMDLYDPLKCKSDLLWLLAWTMGFRYDDRNGLSPAYNRLILLYFMSMIRKKGSREGVTLAAEVNLAQFNIMDRATKGYTDVDGNEVPPNPALYDRLEDTSIPANSVYVAPNVEKGYIDVVYFSTEKPVDACIEYVRPLGVYLFQHAGVRYDAKTKITIDARLTGVQDDVLPVSPSYLAHYTRNDYARLQRDDASDTRDPVYNRNSEAELPGSINPGYRSIYSLQLCNNENVFRSLMRGGEVEKIFAVGYTQDDFTVEGEPVRPWNLLYSRTAESAVSDDVYTIDEDRTIQHVYPLDNPRPAVNPVMAQLGDAMDALVLDPQTGEWVPSENRKFLMHDDDEVEEVNAEDI